MNTFLRNLLCRLIGHNEGVTIRYGYAETKCQRCGWVRSVEAVPRVPA
jgi:hypothetical protein